MAAARMMGGTGLFVVNRFPRAEPTLARLIDGILPYLVSKSETSEWPGTKLFGHTATVYAFRLAAPVFELLTSYASGLYEWLQPKLPEDLSFLCFDQRPWLTTISHERDSYLTMSEMELKSILDAVPQLEVSRDEPGIGRS